MVCLLKIVIFHGYVRHTQMVNPIKAGFVLLKSTQHCWLNHWQKNRKQSRFEWLEQCQFSSIVSCLSSAQFIIVGKPSYPVSILILWNAKSISLSHGQNMDVYGSLSSVSFWESWNMGIWIPAGWGPQSSSCSVTYKKWRKRLWFMVDITS